MTARKKLTRKDGRVYLNRWGIEWKRFGGIFLHKMEAPDPGEDMHDHPWTFWSLILRGGYREDVAHAGSIHWNDVRHKWLSIHRMRKSQCHQIMALNKTTSWSLVVHGPIRHDRDHLDSPWGFFTPRGWVDSHTYDNTRRDGMVEERRLK